MTHELVCTNITYVMEDERRKQTEQNLIKSGGSRYDGFRKQIDSQMMRWAFLLQNITKHIICYVQMAGNLCMDKTYVKK